MGAGVVPPPSLMDAMERGNEVCDTWVAYAKCDVRVAARKARHDVAS